MQNPIAITDRGILKQWDGTATGLGDLNLTDWGPEFDYPAAPVFENLNFVVVPGDVGRRDVGVVSWFFNATAIFLVRLDGHTDPTNTSLLNPRWLFALNAQVVDPYSRGPMFELLGKLLVVLDTTTDAATVLRVYDVDTAVEVWHVEVQLPQTQKHSTMAILSTSWGGSIACVRGMVQVFGTEREHTAAGPGPTPPNTESTLTCYDVAAKTQLWTAAVHYRPLHPAAGWVAGEFGAVVVATTKGVLVLCVRYFWNAVTKGWNFENTKVRAYDIATGKLAWTQPASARTTIAPAQFLGAFFRDDQTGTASLATF
jgi:hypothetical protein